MNQGMVWTQYDLEQYQSIHDRAISELYEDAELMDAGPVIE